MMVLGFFFMSFLHLCHSLVCLLLACWILIMVEGESHLRKKKKLIENGMKSISFFFYVLFNGCLYRYSSSFFIESSII